MGVILGQVGQATHPLDLDPIDKANRWKNY